MLILKFRHFHLLVLFIKSMKTLIFTVYNFVLITNILFSIAQNHFTKILKNDNSVLDLT